MKINVLVIGDELLNGQVSDINSAMIAREALPYGFTVGRVVTVGDDAGEIESQLHSLTANADAVVTTGGLGPTKDDITKTVFCRLTNSELVFNREAHENARRVMAERGLDLNRLTATQAMLPESCTPVPNRVGTAPGMLFTIAGKPVIAMPGVPFEAEAMFAGQVMPLLRSILGVDEQLARRTVLLSGISESAVAEKIETWEEHLGRDAHLAYLPANGYLRLRLDVGGNDAEKKAEGLQQQLCQLLEEYVFDTRDMTPPELLLSTLIEHGLTFACAESCTGGNIAHSLTLIPGSSQAVLGGVVAYSNSVKQSVLGVEAATLSAHGAVSQPTAAEMANGVARVTGADLAISTTGIAGPGGAVEGKPVGTVCFGICYKGKITTFMRHLPGGRSRVIERATNVACIEAVKIIRENNH